MDELKKTTSFEELIVWQKAHKLTLEIYKFTETFPKTETYGLTSQFRRAAVSIAANIAEGYKKQGRLDKVRFFNIAHGSLEECRYYLLLSRDLGYGSNEMINGLMNEIGKMLNAYSKAILSRVSVKK
jgi:four helix bundle protein